MIHTPWDTPSRRATPLTSAAHFIREQKVIAVGAVLLSGAHRVRRLCRPCALRLRQCAVPEVNFWQLRRSFYVETVTVTLSGCECPSATTSIIAHWSPSFSATSTLYVYPTGVLRSLVSIGLSLTLSQCQRSGRPFALLHRHGTQAAHWHVQLHQPRICHAPAAAAAVQGHRGLVSHVAGGVLKQFTCRSALRC
jgi:hypothetical protein